MEGETRDMTPAKQGGAHDLFSDSVVPGQTIAERYLVLDELGRGAQATVFRVRDLELDEEVALKVLSLESPSTGDAATQFKQEIKLARRIVHSNVCRIYDFGRWKDLLFVSMELIPGTTLSEVLREDTSWKIDERLAIFRDILIGLRAAHSLGIVHRDIKPQNIMLTPEGRAVVMDFGLAGEEGKSGKARGGTVLGTPAYIAPERMRGVPADKRSDIYSLGVVLFELSTGKKPFTGNIAEIIHKHLHEEPPRVREIESSLPESVDIAVARMLKKSAVERFASVDQILEVLAEIRSTPVGRTVLLAEGDDDLRALVEQLLTANGLVVTSTGNGEEAVELLLRERPDIIVLDLEMPKIDGFRIAEMLSHYQHLSGVPIYVLSRVRDSSYLAYARQIGVTKLIRRPFAVRAFVEDLLDQLENN